jgi:hypothetical protein
MEGQMHLLTKVTPRFIQTSALRAAKAYSVESIKSLSTIAPLAVQIDLVTIESVFPIKQISVPTFINKIFMIHPSPKNPLN